MEYDMHKRSETQEQREARAVGEREEALSPLRTRLIYVAAENGRKASSLIGALKANKMTVLLGKAGNFLRVKKVKGEL